jgi:hypothetical protein
MSATLEQKLASNELSLGVELLLTEVSMPFRDRTGAALT